jgi:hypothetical protein
MTESRGRCDCTLLAPLVAGAGMGSGARPSCLKVCRRCQKRIRRDDRKIRLSDAIGGGQSAKISESTC